MSWLTWRQYRLQGVIALALLAAFAAYEIPAGFQLASAWHAANTCTGPACRGTSAQQAANDLRVLSVLVPGIIGALLGAPLVAHELETGTAAFAWTQNITRRRWLLVKAGWLLLAAALCAGAVTALVTFWSGPLNAETGSQFQGNYYDTQAIVPVGYAVFATALGIAAGAVLRRTLPAIGVTVAVFIGLRIWFVNSIRLHLMPAVRDVIGMASPFSPAGPPPWIISDAVISRSGQLLKSGFGVNGIPLTPACAQLIGPNKGGDVQGGDMTAALSCMQKAGYHQVITYQPGSRYWPFQGIETGVYLLLAAALIAVAWYAVRRRDA